MSKIELNQKQKDAICKLLVSVGSMSSSRYDQHLRYHTSDENADIIIEWLAENVHPSLKDYWKNLDSNKKLP